MLASLPRSLLVSLTMLLLSAGLHTGWLVFRWGDAAAQEWYSDLHYLLVAGLFLVVVAQLFHRRTEGLRVAFLWLLAHALVRFGAESVWVFLELIVKVPPFPSVADGLYFLAYLLQGGAFLALARQPLRSMSTARLALDSLIVVGAVGVFSWYLFLAQIASNPGEPLLTRLVSLAYPIFDLFLLSLLLLAVFRTQRLRPHEVLFAFGLGLNIVGDYLFAYFTYTGTYATGNPIDALWAWSFVIEGFGAALAMRSAPQEQRGVGALQLNATLLAPYLALLSSFALLLRVYEARSLAATGALWGTALVTLLVMVRQIVMFADNARLHRALAAREAQVAHLALHDALTELPNRRALMMQLHDAVRCAQVAGSRLAVLFIDLDGFKRINDTLGHAAGDTTLKEIAGRLRSHVPPEAHVARLSGDEFAVVLPDLPDTEAPVRVGRRLLAALDEPFILDGTSVNVGASIGVGIWPDHASDSEELLGSADAAMYHVKAHGKHDVQLFSPDLDAHRRARQGLECALRGALDRNEVSLRYQPLCDLAGKVVGAEALMRWKHLELGEVSPERFIPVAEDLGLIVPFGEWVLREACRQAAEWRLQGLTLRIAVNVSPAQLACADFPDQVWAALARAQLPAEALELEITERLVVQDGAQTAGVLETLGRQGVRIVIDDFGVGHSALAYLLRLPITGLKIDRSFVQQLQGRGNSEQGTERVVQAVTSLAHSLGLSVVAEGIETVSQRQRVHDLGCDYLQGYLLAPPLTPSDFESWWRAHEVQRQREQNAGQSAHLQAAELPPGKSILASR
ncbi:putative bifunctional diguanylate cyclase/phosphodiesterase [Deinococcus humi]|uniref:Diguanylate cyclase (GGDEF)-like protein n=1 Tax=Deinococcus humi TaxID=662880 RepID=A0A7W8JXT5_9DEIO|nr:EAL domain-containing protein [Deinococcus humi]MBB5365211.1 diguanylate cyclase (GGDEF)-like protein [Deinococcus humi]GGO35625.1 hypothetical protein GCM10008949_38380 [Deinococcus humi]